MYKKLRKYRIKSIVDSSKIGIDEKLSDKLLNHLKIEGNMANSMQKQKDG